jgi:hypothetical protein
MIYSILLYGFFILPVSIKYYKKDGTKKLFIKILNSLITLFVFISFAGSMWRLINGASNNIFLIKDASLWLNIPFSIFYGIMAFISIILVIRLASRNESARGPFLKVIPLLWLLKGFDNYYAYLYLANETPGYAYIIFSNVLYGLIWGSIFLFYSNRNVKEFFLTGQFEQK